MLGKTQSGLKSSVNLICYKCFFNGILIIDILTLPIYNSPPLYFNPRRMIPGHNKNTYYMEHVLSVWGKNWKTNLTLYVPCIMFQCVDKPTRCSTSYEWSLLSINWLYTFQTITSPSSGASSHKLYNALVRSCYQASLAVVQQLDSLSPIEFWQNTPLGCSSTNTQVNELCLLNSWTFSTKSLESATTVLQLCIRGMLQLLVTCCWNHYRR